MKTVIGLLAAQLVALPVVGGTALAAPSQNQRFFATGRVEAPSITIVASGVIDGAGSLTAEAVDYRESDRTYRETDLAVIGGGTLTISVDGRFDRWPFTLDPRTCEQQGNMTGQWAVTAGGGEFAGATGHGTLSGHFVTYARRGPTGCDEAALRGFVAGPMVGALSLGGVAPDPG